MENYDTLRGRFDDDGFVIIRGLWDSDTLSEVQSHVDRYVREIVPTLPQEAAFFTDYSRRKRFARCSRSTGTMTGSAS